MQNISFQGRTNLVFSNIRYDELNEHVTTARRKCSNGMNQFLTKRTFGIDMENSPLVVFVRGDKEGVIQRYTHGKNTSDLLLELEEKINQLKKDAQEKMTAWILGGKANDERTTITVNKIADVICDRPDIDTSILTGDKINTTERILVRGNSQGTEIIFPKLKGIKDSYDVEDVFEIAELNNTQILF
mgnify:CR=1 FL=1